MHPRYSHLSVLPGSPYLFHYEMYCVALESTFSSSFHCGDTSERTSPPSDFHKCVRGIHLGASLPVLSLLPFILSDKCNNNELRRRHNL